MMVWEMTLIARYQSKIKEETVRFDFPQYLLSTCPNDLPPQLVFNINQAVTGPLYVYYELENFYQNHRRYVSSRDANQLLGKVGNGFAIKIFYSLFVSTILIYLIFPDSSPLK
jgi:hypothetical protein